MAKWHRDGAESSWLRQAAEDAKRDGKEKGWRGEGGSRADTVVDESRNDVMVDRVARSGSTNEWNLSC